MFGCGAFNWVAVAILGCLLPLNSANALQGPALGAAQGATFSTGVRLTSAEVIALRPFDAARFGNLAYVDSQAGAPSLDRLFLESIERIGVFRAVRDADGLKALAIEKTPSEPIGDLNLSGLQRMSRTIGPFAVIEPRVRFLGGYSYEASIRVIDPETNKVMFLARHKATNWIGLGGPLFNPLLNALSEWCHGVPASAAKN